MDVVIFVLLFILLACLGFMIGNVSLKIFKSSGILIIDETKEDTETWKFEMMEDLDVIKNKKYIRLKIERRK